MVSLVAMNTIRRLTGGQESPNPTGPITFLFFCSPEPTFWKTVATTGSFSHAHNIQCRRDSCVRRPPPLDVWAHWGGLRDTCFFLHGGRADDQSLCHRGQPCSLVIVLLVKCFPSQQDETGRTQREFGGYSYILSSIFTLAWELGKIHSFSQRARKNPEVESYRMWEGDSEDISSRLRCKWWVSIFRIWKKFNTSSARSAASFWNSMGERTNLGHLKKKCLWRWGIVKHPKT